MNGSNILANRYAIAFLNLYSAKITEKDFFNIIEIYNTISGNLDIFLMLEFSDIKEKKQLFIDKFINHFSLIFEFSKLLNLLIDSNRTILFKKILEFIIWKYPDYVNKHYFSLSSSHELSESEIEVIKRFLKNISHGDIMYKYNIDKKLIAGIRAVSTNLLWEYSVYAQLQKARRTFEVSK
ncbi:hypothetical protein A3F66_03675 [candidate division TM6 bacterium RIFCSPHIGHO2_12_FULL_32_22]|nr:MAG: hypothetical protein A3F66_03675 [candidate division TM6 bacterium RIFCSPHIGHO2_12_FULL_32_22]